MNDKELELILSDAVDQGANADQIRELHARLTGGMQFREQTPQKSTSATMDVIKGGATGLGRGLMLPLDIGSQIIPGMKNVAEYLGTKAANAITGRETHPEYVEMPPSISRAVLPYEAETTPGKMAELSGEFTTGALPFLKGPAIASQALKFGVPAGIGNEVLGQIAEGTPYEQPLRLVGTIVSPSIASKVGSGTLNIAKGIGAQSGEDLSRLQESIFSPSKEIYKKIDEIGAGFKPQALEKLFGKIVNKLRTSPMVPEYNKYSEALIKQMGDLASRGELTLGKLDQYRRMFRDAPATIGEKGVTPKAIQKTIDTWLDSLGTSDFTKSGREAVSLLYKGRGEFKRAAQIEDMAELVKKTGGDPLKIKKAFKQYIIDNPDLSEHSPEVQKAIREAAKTGAGEWLMNVFGKAGIDFEKPTYFGSFLPTAAGVGGGVAGSIALPATVAGATTAKYGGKLMARGKAQEVLNRMIKEPAISKQTTMAEEVPAEISGLLERPSVNVPPGGFTAPPLAAIQYGRPFSKPLQLTYTETPDFVVTPRGNVVKNPQDIFLETLLGGKK